MAGPTYFFLTNAPPLFENAFGEHVVALQFIKAMGKHCVLVISRRYRWSVSPSAIHAASPVPVYLFPDSAPLAIRRFSVAGADLVDLIGAWLGHWRARKYGRTLQPTRLFALVSGNGWFLLIIWLMAWATRLPFELYMGDDLERSAVVARRKLLARLMPRLERAVLRRAARVFVISQGFAEHLQRKYGQPGEWLPLPMEIDSFVHRPFIPSMPDVRRIVFVGGLNALYIPAIREFYEVIQERNRRCRDFRLVLQVVSYAGSQSLVAALPNTDDLEFHQQVPVAELRERCAASWATFLPYSFEPEVREMVATSFSSKLTDSYRAGRPILVYGPPYTSLARYWQEAGLPLLATSREALPAAIESIAELDSSALIERYAETWRRYHSPEAIWAKLSAVVE